MKWGKFKHFFCSAGSYNAEPASRQVHVCLVRIAVMFPTVRGYRGSSITFVRSAQLSEIELFHFEERLRYTRDLL